MMFENKLTIPKRPKWNKIKVKLKLIVKKNLAFLSWRRELAQLTENNDLLLTPLKEFRSLETIMESCRKMI